MLVCNKHVEDGLDRCLYGSFGESAAENDSRIEKQRKTMLEHWADPNHVYNSDSHRQKQSRSATQSFINNPNRSLNLSNYVKAQIFPGSKFDLHLKKIINVSAQKRKGVPLSKEICRKVGNSVSKAYKAGKYKNAAKFRQNKKDKTQIDYALHHRNNNASELTKDQIKYYLMTIEGIYYATSSRMVSKDKWLERFNEYFTEKGNIPPLIQNDMGDDDSDKEMKQKDIDDDDDDDDGDGSEKQIIGRTKYVFPFRKTRKNIEASCNEEVTLGAPIYLCGAIQGVVSAILDEAGAQANDTGANCIGINELYFGFDKWKIKCDSNLEYDSFLFLLEAKNKQILNIINRQHDLQIILCQLYHEIMATEHDQNINPNLMIQDIVSKYNNDSDLSSLVRDISNKGPLYALCIRCAMAVYEYSALELNKQGLNKIINEMLLSSSLNTREYKNNTEEYVIIQTGFGLAWSFSNLNIDNDESDDDMDDDDIIEIITHKNEDENILCKYTKG
eukprot:154825_1